MENESKTENESQAARLLEKHGDRVFRTAFMYLKNYQDAEDVLQMTFEKYLIAKPLFKNDEHEKAWFLRVAINISKNLVTSGWKRKVIYDDEQLRLFADEAVAQDNTGDSDDNSEAVLKAVLALPKNLSVVIQLFYYEEYSVAQIADLLDISVGNVTTRLNRARKKLEKSLREV
jgi:RNA polymerase sigma factor (sigma-70 family)